MNVELLRFQINFSLEKLIEIESYRNEYNIFERYQELSDRLFPSAFVIERVHRVLSLLCFYD